MAEVVVRRQGDGYVARDGQRIIGTLAVEHAGNARTLAIAAGAIADHVDREAAVEHERMLAAGASDLWGVDLVDGGRGFEASVAAARVLIERGWIPPSARDDGLGSS